MSFIEIAISRRSVRSYTDSPIILEDLKLCVKAARYAPSACNSQPWKFIIVNDSPEFEKIKNTFDGLYKMNIFAKDANAFIVMVSEKMKIAAWLGSKISRTKFRSIDIGIACSHIVLQAQELGIGTCILGWFNQRRIKRILSIPRSKKIELIIAMGYPAEPITRGRNLKDKLEVISHNKY